ncbi:hypothetical protein E8E11_010240 [Didymella keratinophila]|nr:hypothetical protein E8E11_010240 [Didymella keratinophila]
MSDPVVYSKSPWISSKEKLALMDSAEGHTFQQRSLTEDHRSMISTQEPRIPVDNEIDIDLEGVVPAPRSAFDQPDKIAERKDSASYSRFGPILRSDVLHVRNTLELDELTVDDPKNSSCDVTKTIHAAFPISEAAGCTNALPTRSLGNHRLHAIDEDEDEETFEDISSEHTSAYEIDLFGSSTPAAGFFTPSSKLSNGPSFASRGFQAGNTSSGPALSFATTRSSMASYATAASGPRRLWNPPTISTKSAHPDQPGTESGADKNDDEAYAKDMMVLESLTDAILYRILEDRFSRRPLDDQNRFGQFFGIQYSSKRLPVTVAAKSRLEQDRSWSIILDKIQSVHDLFGEDAKRGSAKMDSIIEEIVEEARSYLRKENGVELGDAHNLRYDVATQILDFVSHKRGSSVSESADRFRYSQPFSSNWLTYLATRGILQDDLVALDWSGRGQHVEYSSNEGHLIPLAERRLLGFSRTAVVQSVKCRRIMLARKRIRCNRSSPKELLITEAEHLQRVQHQHIVRLVGTYTYKKELAILLYPVAEWNLEEYLDERVERLVEFPNFNKAHLMTFLGCLSNALAFIHGHNVKHMDIKPGNLLIRDTGGTHRIYIADFGISRAYASAEESNTDSPTSCTRIYAAPEVALQDTRGFAADVFSLGCVFLEIFSALLSIGAINRRAELAKIRTSHNDRSYQMNRVIILQWFDMILTGYVWLEHDMEPRGYYWTIPGTTRTMMSEKPHARPTAQKLAEVTEHLCCGTCGDGPEPFEASKG